MDTINKKKIKIKFVDFWPGFKPDDNYFYNLLIEHFEVALTNEPDYIIYSVFGDKHLQYDCIRIFYTGENIDPDFNLCDYAIGFSPIQYGDRYLRYPLYYLYEKDFERALNKHLIADGVINKKSRFCDFIFSNQNAEAIRVDFFKKLIQYKHIDAGGECLNNLGYRVKDKYEFQLQSKFSIAFENSSTRGYSTEKIIQAFAACTVPIYWGNPDIDKEFNPDSFINCHRFSNFDEAIEEIKRIDHDDDLYRQMLKAPIYNTDNKVGSEKDLLIEFFSDIFLIDPQKARRRPISTRQESYENRIRFSYLRSKKKIHKAIAHIIFNKRHH